MSTMTARFKHAYLTDDEVNAMAAEFVNRGVITLHQVDTFVAIVKATAEAIEIKRWLALLEDDFDCVEWGGTPKSLTPGRIGRSCYGQWLRVSDWSGNPDDDEDIVYEAMCIGDGLCYSKEYGIESLSLLLEMTNNAGLSTFLFTETSF